MACEQAPGWVKYELAEGGLGRAERSAEGRERIGLASLADFALLRAQRLASLAKFFSALVGSLSVRRLSFEIN